MNGLALCAGGGGLELGLGLALGDYRTVCYVEREAYAASVLAARMEDGRLDQAPIWDDLTSFDGRQWRGKVDILSAGFPCQPFSGAGKRQGDRDARHIWPHVRRVINGARPSLVFLENVSAIISTRQRDGRPAYMVVRNELERLGYRVAETLIRASDVGAPHQRERLFILGHTSREGLPLTEQPGQPGTPGAGRGDGAATPELRGAPVDDTDGSGQRAGGIRGVWPNAGEAQPPVADTGRRCVQRWRVSGGLGRTAGEGETSGGERQRHGRAVDHRGQAFPPGPGDRHAWTAILSERPELAPALEHAAGVSGRRRNDQRVGEAERDKESRESKPRGVTFGPFDTGAAEQQGGETQPAVCRVADGMAAGMEFRTARLRLLGNGVVPAQAAEAFRRLWELI